MKKTITLAGFLLFTIFCSAQTKTTIIYNFTGAVSKYPIEMQLQITPATNTVDGEYYYLKSGIGAKLDVKGLKKSGDSILLTEENFRIRDKNNKFLVTGSFSLQGKDTLTGTWKNEKTGAILPVKLTMREKINLLQPADFNFKMKTYQGKMTDAGNHERMYTKSNQLDIYRNNKLLQIINGYDECLSENSAEVIMEDLNFDGYLDIKIPVYFPERTKYDGSFVYFIYNKSTGKFEKNKQLIDLEYLTFDPVKKEIYRYDEGPDTIVKNYYKWKDGKVYLARTEKDN
ncbi:hypothetical protein [Chitinophaga sp. Cy-1792]|uniref:XAC2610-related protein n=1 Tax=Chitinophaga sp. Cy-1792 TaxID=2608339 RepID=UPI00141FF875|nr:hypothetical protein [Chitinophaga sp. Cy-1792]NIG54650.1 hypothetical protein [Chitinophaga sp. Cy-1792]